MPEDPNKWIRSNKENPAGKVVADPEGNRWEWQAEDDTSRLLNKLNNDELAIEKTDLHPTAKKSPERKAAAHNDKLSQPRLNPAKRDLGGGFNPYDHAGKPKRR